MRIYEELFILKPDVTEEGAEGAIEIIRHTVEGSGGTVDKVDMWGVRRLAYRVAKHDEGFYILVQFSAGSTVVKEIERRLRVSDDVLKFLTVRIDEKLKWLEKRKKIREKRASRRPSPPPPQAMPAAPPAPPPPQAPVPGLPAEPTGASHSEGSES